MVTLSFRCPQCGMPCIWGTYSADEAMSLAGDLPIHIPCAACGNENLICREARDNDLVGQHGSYVELCLKIAGFCRRRADTMLFPVVQSFFHRMETLWLERAADSEMSRQATVIAARDIRLSRPSSSRQTA
jgi:hypothetical protein